ncbi:MAG: NTP transferase domain-containing protein [Phycisphaerales bacterium]|jgi:UDP-N-acetylglucosamine diphosphorylase/glucosamine-1-phosphate N-acetyltransferase|nr:NTP transferase domain-containing protein [Phycisphaerales bacterium]
MPTHPSITPDPTLSAIVLAAGKGTRMKSDLPKVVHEVGGRPMVCAVVDACLAAGCSRIVAVVGYMRERVRDALAGYGDRVAYALQEEQLGTGHAVMSAKELYERESAAPGHSVFVLAGDGPLIRAETLRTMLDLHRRTNAAATLATSEIADPTGYGRIVRDASGRFERIVEHRNATPEQRAIREVYPSYAVFDARALFRFLPEVPKNPAAGEYYVTDLFELLQSRGERVEVVRAVPPEDVLSINTPDELAVVDRIYRGRAGAVVAGGGA